MQLFSTCLRCGSASQAKVTRTIGSLVQVDQHCVSADCRYRRSWSSQPFINHMPVGNLLLSAAILMSGLVAAQALRLFNFLQVPYISKTTYFRHQTKYVIPIIIQTWRKHQSELIAKLQGMGGGLELSGDGRSDSPGHSAKFGGYNIIEETLGKVIDIQLVQVIRCFCCNVDNVQIKIL